MNYFTLFGLPINYPVDDNQLRSRFQDLQRQFHPDRFVCQPENERLIALQKATAINAAYQTLKHSLKCAEYILSLYGFNLIHEQQTLQDPAFLAEQLELYEELDNIANKINTENLLSKFSLRLNKAIKQRYALITQQLNNQQWPEAADTVRKMKFLNKLQQQVKNLKETMLGFE
ncbi:co-chaperone HscB [Candidatus Gillettellia adelgis]